MSPRSTTRQSQARRPTQRTLLICLTMTAPCASCPCQVQTLPSTLEPVARLPVDTARKSSQLMSWRSMKGIAMHLEIVHTASRVFQGLSLMCMRRRGVLMLWNVGSAANLFLKMKFHITRTTVGSLPRSVSSAKSRSRTLTTSTNTKLKVAPMLWSANTVITSSPGATSKLTKVSAANLITARSAWMSSDLQSCQFIRLNAHS